MAEVPTEANGQAQAHTTPTNGNPEANGQATNGEAKNKPCKSFSVAAGNGVYIETSIWPKEITVENRQILVYSITCRKTYKKDDGSYGNTTFFRGSEVHLVQYVLGLASNWVLDQRREEEPPF